MNRLTIGMLVVVTLTVTSKAEATILADAVDDFVPATNAGEPGIVPATGTGEWRYLASDTVNPASDPDGFDLLTGGVITYVNATSGGSLNQVGIQHPDLAADEVGVGASGFSRSPEFTFLRPGRVRRLPRSCRRSCRQWPR